MIARLFSLVIPALVVAAFCNASTFVFNDLSETLSVSLDGAIITGNGGRISNFTLTPELVSFDVSTNGINFITTAGFTNLLDPVNSDDPVNTLSDRIVLTFTQGANTYHAAFGSDPAFPNIPPGAIDLTTVATQGLPPNPYYENGNVQKVATVFRAPNTVLDTYFVVSDVVVPEPDPMTLVGVGLLAVATARRKPFRQAEVQIPPGSPY